MDTPTYQRRRRLRLAVRLASLAFAMLALDGCLPDSRHPIAAPDPMAADPEILGSWGAHGEDGDEYFHVFRPTGGVPGAVEIIAVGFEKDKSGEVERYCGYLSRIGKSRYMNLAGPVDKCSDAAGQPFLFVAYNREPSGRLQVRLMREDAVKKAIGQGKLAGEKDAGGGPTSHITADSEAIRAFILADAGGLWDQSITLRRVTAPKP